MSKVKDFDGIRLGIGVATIVIVLAAYLASTWSSVSAAKAAIDSCTEAFCDFQGFYYPMGEKLFDTGLPVKGFVYSPFIATLMSVFPYFGLKVSLFLWGILQGLSVLFYLLLFYRMVPARLSIHLLFTFLVLSSFPVFHNLTWGQVGLFTAIAILAALYFYDRGQLALAAGLAAFGLSFKFFPIIFLVPFAFRRDVRFLLMAAVSCALLLFVVPGIALGINGMLHFYSALLNTYQHFDWVITNYNSQYFPHVILRVAEAMHYNNSIHLPALRWVSLGIALVITGLVFMIQRAHLQFANLWSFHVLFLSIPFILQTSWPVDLVYLPFGQALLTWRLFDGDGMARIPMSIKSGSPSVNAVIGILIVISAVFSNIVFFNLVGDRMLFGSVGFIFWSDLLLLAATFMQLLPVVLRADTQTWRAL